MQRQVETSVRSKILNLIQAWAHAFRNEPKYKVVQDTYQIMKVEGEDNGAKVGGQLLSRSTPEELCRRSGLWVLAGHW